MRPDSTLGCILIAKQFIGYYSEVDHIFSSLGYPRGDAAAPRTGLMANPTAAGELSNRIEVASYVATPSADLPFTVRRTGLDTLGYLLEMVRLETENIYRHADRKNGGRS